MTLRHWLLPRLAKYPLADYGAEVKLSLFHVMSTLEWSESHFITLLSQPFDFEFTIDCSDNKSSFQNPYSHSSVKFPTSMAYQATCLV